ncbi:MAG: hypothetical protein K2Q03_04240 [Sphingobacteriaceae bacterium]|nr:hypothetical protein [Sphingobacteriaceae bacterium]
MLQKIKLNMNEKNLKELLKNAIEKRLNYSKLLVEIYEVELQKIGSNIQIATLINEDLKLKNKILAIQICEIKRKMKNKKKPKNVNQMKKKSWVETETDFDNAINFANDLRTKTDKLF